MSIQSIHELLYLGTSNPLQGQVGERPHQHVEPLLVSLRGPLIRFIRPTAVSKWVEMSILSYS